MIYSQEEKVLIKEYYNKKTYKEIASLIKEKFNIERSVKSLENHVRKNRDYYGSSTKQEEKFYTDLEKAFIKELLHKDTDIWKIVKELKEKLNSERTEASIRTFIFKNRDYFGYINEKKKNEKQIYDFEKKVKNNDFEILNEPDHIDEQEISKIWNDLVEKKKKSLKKNKYNIELKFLKERPIAIAFMSDIHLGNPGTDYETLEKHINIINETDYMYCYQGGDLIDNFIIEKILEAVDATEIRVDTQWRLAEHFLKKLDGKIIALGNGNHTQWTQKKALFDNLKIISQRLNLIYTAHGAFINIKIGSEQEYNLHIRHKFRFNSSINRFNAHQRLYELGPETADILLLEHHHEPGSASFWRHGKKRYAISTGSYKMDDNYALDCGYFSANIGVPAVILFPKERKILQFEAIEDCALIMKYLNQEYE